MPHAAPQAPRERLAQALSDLTTPSDADLKTRWRDLYGTEPPRRVDQSLLIPAIAYRMQEQALGGLKAPFRRHLNARRQRRSRWLPVAELSEASPGARNRPGARLGRRYASGEDARRRIPLSWQAIQIAFRGGTHHHRRSLVGTTVLRSQDTSQRARQWNQIESPSAAAQSTLESPLRRVSNRTSTLCRGSVKPASPTSRASRTRAGA